MKLIIRKKVGAKKRVSLLIRDQVSLQVLTSQRKILPLVQNLLQKKNLPKAQNPRKVKQRILLNPPFNVSFSPRLTF